MSYNHSTLFPITLLVLFATQVSLGQRAVTVPAAPTVTILSAATGAMLQSHGASNASLDLGRVSYFRGTSGPGRSSSRKAKSFVTSTRFALKIDCPGSPSSAQISVTMARVDAAASHVIAIDGIIVETLAQTLVTSMPCGSTGEHRLDVEVPVSTPAGSIGSTVVFLATLRK